MKKAKKLLLSALLVAGVLAIPATATADYIFRPDPLLPENIEPRNKGGILPPIENEGKDNLGGG